MTDRHSDSIPPLLQFTYLLLTIFACAMAGIVLSYGIIMVLYGNNVMHGMAYAKPGSAPEIIAALKIFLIFGNTLPLFLAPALFFGYFVVHEPQGYLRTNLRFPWQLIPLVVVIMLAQNPIMEWMVNINQQLVLPDFLKGLENWMRESERDAQLTVSVITKMDNIGDMLLCLLIIALLPAIAEEFMFRGCVQTIFARWTNSWHWGIWISAILFSAIHVQFFGFLPRMMLGVLFGYLVAWSGSIWTSVLAHFIFNGTAVVATYLYQQKAIKTNPDEAHIFNYPGYIISLIIVLFLLWIYKNIALGKQQELTEQ